MRVVTVRRRVLHVRRRDRDAPLTLLRRVVDRVERAHRVRRVVLRHHLRDRSRQRRLPVVDVTDRPDVHVRLRPVELLFRHDSSCSRCDSSLSFLTRVEPMTGLEPVTSSLPRTRSTTELHRPDREKTIPAPARPGVRQDPAAPRPAGTCWSGRRGSNPRPTAWKAVTLPLSYSRASAAPHRRPTTPAAERGGEGRIRTSEAAWATDLQSVAFDRSATSPTFTSRPEPVPPDAPVPELHVDRVEWDRVFNACGGWRRDSNPRPADYKSAALPD